MGAAADTIGEKVLCNADCVAKIGASEKVCCNTQLGLAAYALKLCVAMLVPCLPSCPVCMLRWSCCCARQRQAIARFSAQYQNHFLII